jgi:ElaB/YqjD/DUF883 family membrane-anchored ribosome-binding protein
MAEQGRSSAEQAQEQVREKAQEATEKARSTLREQVDGRSTQAGEQISQQAGDLRTLSQELRTQGKDGPAKLADQAAERAEQVGGYLTRSDADRILHDAEEFGRSNPWAVIAGGVAVGFLASRFLKASSSDRYHGRTPQGRAQIQPGSAADPDRFNRAPGAPAQPHIGGAPASGPATTPAV